jgi:amphi-Trp domain-containing protein
VPAGIDGEAVTLEPPRRFQIRPGAARAHRAPASRASPSATLPEGVGQSARALAQIAAGRDPFPPIPRQRTLMDIFEVEQKERLGREEVAARLRSLADMLARHNDIEFERGGMRFKVKVPDELNLKLELEVESDGCELEIELTW